MVYVMLAEGFEEIEALTVVDVLRRAGIEVKTVSVSGSSVVTGSHNIPVVSDIQIADADLENAEMIVLPGGMPGTENLYRSRELENAVSHRIENKKWVAAICAAPIVLGRRGYLKGLEAVCYPGFENELEGAVIKNEKVVISGKVITSKGPGTALDFALTIVSVLKDEAVAQKLRAGMQAV